MAAEWRPSDGRAAAEWRWNIGRVSADMRVDWCRSICRPSLGRHIGRVSVDISADISAESIDRYSFDRCLKYTWSDTFWSTKSRIISWQLKVEWEHLFGLFLTDLDENMTSAGYERHQNENSETRLSDKLTIIQFRPCGDSHARRKNSLSLDNLSRVSRKLRTQKLRPKI